MHVTEVKFGGSQPIDSYGPGFFRINGLIHQGNLAVLPGKSDLWVGLSDVAVFLKAKDEFDVLLLGMGAEIAAIPRALNRDFEAADIGVEVMSTPSACRTYNVLLSEGRRIGAALLAL